MTPRVVLFCLILVILLLLYFIFLFLHFLVDLIGLSICFVLHYLALHYMHELCYMIIFIIVISSSSSSSSRSSIISLYVTLYIIALIKCTTIKIL